MNAMNAYVALTLGLCLLHAPLAEAQQKESADETSGARKNSVHLSAGISAMETGYSSSDYSVLRGPAGNLDLSVLYPASQKLGVGVVLLNDYSPTTRASVPSEHSDGSVYALKLAPALELRGSPLRGIFWGTALGFGATSSETQFATGLGGGTWLGYRIPVGDVLAVGLKVRGAAALGWLDGRSVLNNSLSLALELSGRAQ